MVFSISLINPVSSTSFPFSACNASSFSASCARTAMTLRSKPWRPTRSRISPNTKRYLTSDKVNGDVTVNDQTQNRSHHNSPPPRYILPVPVQQHPTQDYRLDIQIPEPSHLARSN